MRIILVLLFSFSIGNITACIAQESNNKAVIGSSTVIEKMDTTTKLRHLVLFKFKENVSKETVSEIEKAFAQLPSKIEQITEFEWGLNISPENLDKGFTHSFLLTFDNENDRDLYLPHPDHKAFVALLEPTLDDVLVIDYFTKTN